VAGPEKAFRQQLVNCFHWEPQLLLRETIVKQGTIKIFINTREKFDQNYQILNTTDKLTSQHLIFPSVHLSYDSCDAVGCFAILCINYKVLRKSA